MQPAAGAVKRVALERGLDLAQPSTFKSPEALERLRAARAELLVVAAYGMLLPPAALEASPLGAINIHASLLPRWRGAAPIQRALLAGDRETGISIMQMDAGLDTGPVLLRKPLAIDAADDAQTLHDKLAALGAAAIVEALEALAAGRLRAEPQPAAGATYARKIDKAEARLDWARPAIELERAVRAFHPAIAMLDGEPLRLWRVRVAQGRGDPGQVLATAPALLVACGEGALDVLEVQRAGGRRMPAAEFLRGRPLAPASRFA
jgi:methionyl-tRNA formyltransferase